ncbi:hypothetical protein [Nostoc sp.]|uniref:hypothetical protein n=1 Tax=Nostoc sp. TaxID=1180 RepID=UPI002FF5A8D7
MKLSLSLKVSARDWGQGGQGELKTDSSTSELDESTSELRSSTLELDESTSKTHAQNLMYANYY